MISKDNCKKYDGEFNEAYFLDFAQSLASEVHNNVQNYYYERFIRGSMQIEYAQSGFENLKAEHKVDQFVKKIIQRHITEEYSQLWNLAEIYIRKI